MERTSILVSSITLDFIPCVACSHHRDAMASGCSLTLAVVPFQSSTPSHCLQY